MSNSSLQEEIDQANSHLDEIRWSLLLYGLFIIKCADLINPTNLSLLPSCDSVYQKYNIALGKFFAENKADIEFIIYPTTLPHDINDKSILNSSSIVGSSDLSVVKQHLGESVGYNTKIKMLSDSCVHATLRIIDGCLRVFESLNDYLKEFYKNTQAEFETIFTLLAKSILPEKGFPTPLTSS